MRAFAAIGSRLLTLASVVTAALAFWRLAADPGWAGDFFIKDGLFSRYQPWFAATVSLQGSAWIINRWVAKHPVPASIDEQPD
jgi:hypothetical protein